MNVKAFLVMTGLVVAAWVFYCASGTLDASDPQRAALAVAQSYGKYQIADLAVAATASHLPLDRSFPLSVLGEQKALVLQVTQAKRSGALQIHLHRWKGFGWKVMAYKDETVSL